jgi:hypothetical protein
VISKTLFYIISFTLLLSFTQCYSAKWNSIDTNSSVDSAPEEVVEIFKGYSNETIILSAKSPAYNYKYDIGEKDSLYGIDTLNLRFTSVEIKLCNNSPKGKILADFQFIDGLMNIIRVNEVDLLRLIPTIEGPNEMASAELLTKEFNRFGYTFRKEHKEFDIVQSKSEQSKTSQNFDNIYRCKITNNCLAAGKWELEVTSEDYSDFDKRLKSNINLNQNKIMAHSWFYLDSSLYAALIKLKNPEKNLLLHVNYDSLSTIAEATKVDFEALRNPIKKRLNATTLEIGHQSERNVVPLDLEQHYKKEFGLVLNPKEYTYKSILEQPIELTQFRDEGFYKDTSIKKCDFNWMKYLDSVSIEVVELKETDAYVQITLSGAWSPYNITLGNVDLAQIQEQKLTGFLFGINTYPKGRRYNPVQSTIAYDPDVIPTELKPYLLLTDKKTDNWVNNQYKGIEKVYLSYESIERDVLLIYVLSYERITPVWMARVELPKSMRELVRIRKSLYNY